MLCALLKHVKRLNIGLCCRWDVHKPATVDNLVLLTFEEAETHESQSLNDVRRNNPQFAEYVEHVLHGAT